jgi:drug/metabolite transporter (DMT)-like permease
MAYAQLVFSTACWVANVYCGHFLVAQITPITLTFFRWCLAAVPLGMLAFVFERPDLKAVLSDWRRQVLLALCGLIGANVFNYLALSRASPAYVALVSAVNPSLILLVASLVSRTAPRIVVIAGIVLSVVGAAVFVGNGDPLKLIQHASLVNVSGLLALCSSVFWALYTVFGRTAKTPPVTSVAAQSAIIAILTGPVLLVTDSRVTLNSAGWIALATVVVFPTVTAFILWSAGIRRLGPERGGVLMNLIPLFTAVVGAILGTPLESYMFTGGGLVIGGALLANVRQRLPQRDAVPPAPVPVPATPSGETGTRGPASRCRAASRAVRFIWTATLPGSLCIGTRIRKRDRP